MSIRYLKCRKGITSAEVTLAREVEVNSVLMDSLNKVVSGKVEIRKNR